MLGDISGLDTIVFDFLNFSP